MPSPGCGSKANGTKSCRAVFGWNRGDLSAYLSAYASSATAMGRTGLVRGPNGIGDQMRAGFWKTGRPDQVLSYDHLGPPADGVYTRNALHQLPDFWKAVALERIARAMRPGGVLRLRDLIYDFTPAEAPEVFQSWFDHAASDPADGYTGADYAEHIRTEFSTFRWLLEAILAATGFQIVTAEYDRRLYGAYTCIKAS